MTADHPVSPEDLMAYLDGELPQAQAAVVHAHVAGCDGCQRATSDLRGVSRDMARWRLEIPPPTLTAPWRPPEKAEERGGRFRWLLRPPVAFAALILVAAALARATYPAMSSRQMMAAESEQPVSATSPTMAGAGLPPAFARETAAQPKLTPSIARMALLRLSTRDFEATRSAVDRIVAGMEGWFGNVSVSKNGPARSLRATVHLPVARLDAALAALKPLGTVLEESLQGEDVTEQIVDVEVRLSNARNTEKRLLDLLQKRTGALEDVLAAEREMARVREEIERFDAQRKNLERRVTYATLTLGVTEETQATLNLGPRPIGGTFRDAFVTGATEAVDMALGLALLVVRVAPSLVLWSAVLAWPVLIVVRRSRRLNRDPEPGS